MLSSVSDQEINELVSHLDQVEIRPGECVYDVGDPGDCMYVVERGQVIFFYIIRVSYYSSTMRVCTDGVFCLTLTGARL